VQEHAWASETRDARGFYRSQGFDEHCEKIFYRVAVDTK
jgi:hypothetical protein